MSVGAFVGHDKGCLDDKGFRWIQGYGFPYTPVHAFFFEVEVVMACRNFGSIIRFLNEVPLVFVVVVVVAENALGLGHKVPCRKNSASSDNQLPHFARIWGKNKEIGTKNGHCGTFSSEYLGFFKNCSYYCSPNKEKKSWIV
jgi:hypothetical protein